MKIFPLESTQFLITIASISVLFMLYKDLKNLKKRLNLYKSELEKRKVTLSSVVVDRDKEELELIDLKYFKKWDVEKIEKHKFISRSVIYDKLNKALLKMTERLVGNRR